MLVTNKGQQPVQIARFARVQPRCGFVQAEELGPGAHRAGDLEPPLCPIRKIARVDVRDLGQRRALEPIAREVDRFPLGPAEAGRAEQPQDRHA